MPPSDHAVVRGGRRAGHAGSVSCGFGFGFVLPCRALPPAGRAHARLMRAPLAARSAGAALSSRPTVVFFGGSFCWCCALYPPDCRVLWSLACGHRGSKADPLPLMGDRHSVILGDFGLMWACDCHPLLLTPALFLLGVSGFILRPAAIYHRLRWVLRVGCTRRNTGIVRDSMALGSCTVVLPTMHQPLSS